MKVLVIDDDKFLRTLLQSELEQANMQVVIAGDGEEGIVKAKAEKPDVIVLDLILPKLDGFELIAELQKIPGGKHASIFIFSDLSQEQDKEEALRLGARGYFKKGENTVHHIVEAISALVIG